MAEYRFGETESGYRPILNGKGQWVGDLLKPFDGEWVMKSRSGDGSMFPQYWVETGLRKVDPNSLLPILGPIAQLMWDDDPEFRGQYTPFPSTREKQVGGMLLRIHRW